MSVEAQPVPSRREPSTLTWSRVAWLASIVFFGVFPALVLVVLASDVRGETIAIDLHQFYSAAQAILDGRSPYPPNGEPTTPWGGPYPYPPLPALLVTPLSLLPLGVAGALLMTLLACAALAVPFVLGVRDWRCYGLALLWPPVISAIQTGNLTLWLALACAVAWRYRDRRILSSASVGITLAAKFFLWPLVVWFAATRRTASAMLACVVGIGVLLISWAVIGFAGFVDYPHLLRRLDELVGEDSYTTYIVGLDLGLPSLVSRGLWLALGLALVVCVALLARNGDERTAFIVAVAASLALMPIVWLHYFALLLVVVALVQPRLGALWFLPLALVITPGSGHPSPFDTAWALGVVATTIAYATWLSSAEGRRVRVETTPAVEATAT